MGIGNIEKNNRCIRKNHSIVSADLLRIREYTGYSKETLAKLLGLDEKLIGQWESGEIEPTISQVLLLSRLYGIPVDDIFCSCEVMDVLPEDKREEFNHNAWLNRVANRRYCW